MSNTASKAVTVLSRVVSEPRLATEVMRKAFHRLSMRYHTRRIREYEELAVTADDAVARLLGVGHGVVVAHTQESTFVEVNGELDKFTQYVPEMGGGGRVDLCYALARIIQPGTVIETGVASGYSTAAILQALEDNESGQLFSIDLPVFHPNAPSHTGDAIPEPLRSSSKWTLLVGPDRRVLPSLLADISEVDFFHYDSDKSYEGMMHTWKQVWAKLKPGGVLMADDVESNDAFLDFCDSLGLEPIVVPKPQRTKVYYVGLIRKPEG